MIRLFARLVYRCYRLFSRGQDWGQRRFTPLGLTLLAGLAMAVAVGANTEQSIGFQIVMIILCLLLIGIVWALFFRGSFQVERVLPRFGCVNETLNYRVWLQNDSDKEQRGLQYLEEFHYSVPDFDEFYERLRPSKYNRTFRLSSPLPGVLQARTKAYDIAPLPPRGRVQVTGNVTPLKRGALHFRNAIICRADPLGVFRSFRRVPAPQTVLILPKRYMIPNLSLPGTTKYQHGGVSLASGIGESEEFTALREYRRGDSLRRIHWRSFARLGKPIVKEFQSEFFVRHALLLDTFCNVALDDVFEDAVAVAASFACTIPDQDSLLDLMFVGPKTVCLTAGRGVGHAAQMLEILAAVKPNREAKFNELGSMVLRHSNDLSGCILVLMAWDEPRRELIRQLKTLQIPQHVMLMVRPGETAHVDRGPAADQPTRMTIIESGHVEAALSEL